tara:strand:+ start:379 stop:612 length:234 start_codon:yes stop_codon:yes gene_type:complete
MKWILITYICSVATGECPSNSITGFQFNNHYDCVVAGYKYSHNKFTKLEELEELEREYIEQKKLVIKFECKNVNTAT